MNFSVFQIRTARFRRERRKNKLKRNNFRYPKAKHQKTYELWIRECCTRKSEAKI